MDSEAPGQSEGETYHFQSGGASGVQLPEPAENCGGGRGLLRAPVPQVEGQKPCLTQVQQEGARGISTLTCASCWPEVISSQRARSARWYIS